MKRQAGEAHSIIVVAVVGVMLTVLGVVFWNSYNKQASDSALLNDGTSKTDTRKPETTVPGSTGSTINDTPPPPAQDSTGSGSETKKAPQPAQDSTGSGSETKKVLQPAQEEAIRQAKAYQIPKGAMCASVMTKAIHVESGANYTFTSSCLPDGWVVEKNYAAAIPALEQAKAWRGPEGAMCAAVMTRANHTATGLKYTFSMGCLPDGWKAVK